MKLFLTFVGIAACLGTIAIFCSVVRRAEREAGLA